MSQVEYVFILVHGTGSTGARWTRIGSAFRIGLSRIIPRAQFLPFVWTGANSNEARKEAGGRLASRILASSISDPAAKRFVIAHSHGGNVVAYALGDARTKGRLNGICCIGTPFIIFERRKIRASIEILKHVAGILGALWSIPILAGILVFISELLKSVSMKGAEFFFFVVGCFLVPLWFVPFAIQKLYPYIRDSFARIGTSWAERKQEAAMSEFAVPPFDGLPVLCVTAKGDEAGRWLNLISFVAGLPFKLWNGRVAVWAYLLLCTNGCVWQYLSVSPKTGEQYFYIVGFSVMGSIFNLMMLAVFLQIAMAITARLSQGFVRGFGPSNVGSSWVIKITSSAMPLDLATMDRIEYIAPSGGLKGSLLRHSWLHESSEVAEYIARWCASR
jgi:hypothetical protein